MSDGGIPDERAAEWRRRAEIIAREQAASRPESQEALTPEAARRLLHELRVHQIQLEMQNEELRRVQEALEVSRARYFDLFDLAPVGYLTLDDEGMIREANLAAAGLLGQPRGALPGQPLTHFILPADQDIQYQHWRALLQTGARQVGELRLRRQDAVPSWARLESTVTRAADGAAVCHTVLSDISELRQMQASLAQADRLASMGMLAAGVAHEINNPLTYVLHAAASLAQDLPGIAAAAGCCCAALREQGEEAARIALAEDGDGLALPARLAEAVERAAEVEEGSRRIQEIARGLSSFARVERVEQSWVDLGQAIESAVRMAQHEIKYRARLVLELGPVPAIWGSAGKLSQMFLNLLVNAAHAIDEGDVDHQRITIRTRAEDGVVLAEVADTGKGILPEHLERVFEPFFSTKGVGKGSGLGLAICQSFVAELGGQIQVVSQPGQGARFLIRLPVREMAALAPAAGAAAAAVPTPRGRILVVDDEPMIRTLLTRMLGRDHEVITADSGWEGRMLLERDPSFDLILCDLMMPEVTGMDLHAWLAERDPALAARVVFITGGVFTPRAAEYLARAGNPVAEKPFDAPRLRELVSRLIQGTRHKS